MKKIDTDCVKEAVIGHRRTIHRLAELGGKEYKADRNNTFSVN